MRFLKSSGDSEYNKSSDRETPTCIIVFWTCMYLLMFVTSEAMTSLIIQPKHKCAGQKHENCSHPYRQFTNKANETESGGKTRCPIGHRECRSVVFENLSWSVGNKLQREFLQSDLEVQMTDDGKWRLSANKYFKQSVNRKRTKVQKCLPFTAKAWTWSRIRAWSALTKATQRINSATLSVKMHRDRYRPSSAAWYVADRFITRLIEAIEGRAFISCFQIRFC